MVQPDGGTYDNIIGRRRFACWINKATNTHSEYIILITFPLQQCLLAHASVLLSYYIVRLVERLWQNCFRYITGLVWAVS